MFAPETMCRLNILIFNTQTRTHTHTHACTTHLQKHTYINTIFYKNTHLHKLFFHTYTHWQRDAEETLDQLEVLPAGVILQLLKSRD